jgi:hypothetical protein
VQYSFYVDAATTAAWLEPTQCGALTALSEGCFMFGTTASKLAASFVLVAATAGGTAGVGKSILSEGSSSAAPVVPAKVSLLVATLANGAIEMQWMSREACEGVESAVAASNGVAGVREDGVKVYIAQANCSTPRVDETPSVIQLTSSQPRN